MVLWKLFFPKEITAKVRSSRYTQLSTPKQTNKQKGNECYILSKQVTAHNFSINDGGGVGGTVQKTF